MGIKGVRGGSTARQDGDRSQVVAGSLAVVPKEYPYMFPISVEDSGGWSNVGAKLLLSRVSRNPVRLVGETQSYRDASKAEKANKPTGPCPPRAIGRRVRGFPLGAQIGIATIIAGLAWLCFLIGPLRPLGLLAVARCDVAKAVSYGFLNVCLFTLSFGIGIIGRN